jgi:hypothetical protein
MVGLKSKTYGFQRAIFPYGKTNEKTSGVRGPLVALVLCPQ